MVHGDVLVIGGGVAGLSAASDLAGLGLDVQIVEKETFLGGHAIRFSCKATEKCVNCGVCIVDEKLQNVMENPKIKIWTRSRVDTVSRSKKFSVNLSRQPEYINPRKCTGCGVCLDQCPEPGAIIQGFTKNSICVPAIYEQKCRYILNRSCNICQEVCPEKAIQFDSSRQEMVFLADAVIVATGYKPFNPEGKPYGYKSFANVITNLQLEEILKQNSIALRPSDNRIPQKIAFIQCVGSRDVKLKHLWCSKVCCASALCLAGLIKKRQPQTEISLFYIDIQTFGKNFQAFYDAVQGNIRMIRNVPGDIYKTEDDCLQVTYYDTASSTTREEKYDLVVLTIGITPSSDLNRMVELFDMRLDETGFAQGIRQGQPFSVPGVFAAGTTTGPMSIAESVASAAQAVQAVITYLQQKIS
jgi:heterodisulfide reductase subunit A